MKRSFYPILLFLFLAGCKPKGTTLVVTNPSLKERINCLAEVPADSLGLTAENAYTFALYNEDGRNIPYQVMYYNSDAPQSVIFLVDDIRGGMKRHYTWRKGRSAKAQPKVSAQYVAERKDDFAWENDFAAYRMYGPALADENPSNGVDLWLKCTDSLVVADFYDNDLHGSRPYHINWGKGLDCYKVAHTLGCGGIAPYTDGRLLIGNHYTAWEILEQGPLRVIFRLTYPTHTLTVTCDAGSLLNKAEVRMPLPCNCIPSDTLHTHPYDRLAAGIWLHDTTDNITYAEKGKWIAYAENAISDAGHPEGRNYCAVIMPAADTVFVQDRHLLTTAPCPIDDSLTYWFGGGWSQWKYPTDADWFTAVSDTYQHLSMPLVVTIEH